MIRANNPAAVPPALATAAVAAVDRPAIPAGNKKKQSSQGMEKEKRPIFVIGTKVTDIQPGLTFYPQTAAQPPWFPPPLLLR